MEYRARLLAPFALWALALLSHSAALAAEATLILENARVVDPRARSITEGALVIRSGRIEALAAPGSLPDPVEAERIDLKGGWVIPGLVDTHVHAHGDMLPNGGIVRLGLLGASRSMLFSGVTAFLDLFNEENSILELRDEQRSAKPLPEGLLPDIFAAGPILTCSKGHGTEYEMFTRVINTPEQAELEIRALAYKKPDVIKIVYDHAIPGRKTMDYPTLKRAITLSRELGIKSVIHIGTWNDAEEAIDLGADAITHVYAAPIPEPLLKKIKERGVRLIPTMAVQTELLNILDDPALLDRPLLRSLAPARALDSYRKPGEFLPWVSQGYLSWMKEARKGTFANVGAMVGSGLELLSGTDSGNIGVFQGYSLHRELELLVQAGMTPWRALAAATTRAGDFLGQNYGVSVGSVANLVVLDASPIEDIRNTQRIRMVFKRGQLVDRQKLLEKITEAPCVGCR